MNIPKGNKYVFDKQDELTTTEQTVDHLNRMDNSRHLKDTLQRKSSIQKQVRIIRKKVMKSE